MGEHTSPAADGTSAPNHASPPAHQGASVPGMGGFMLQPTRISLSFDLPAIHTALAMALSAQAQSIVLGGPGVASSSGPYAIQSGPPLAPVANAGVQGSAPLVQSMSAHPRASVEERSVARPSPRGAPSGKAPQAVGSHQTEQSAQPSLANRVSAAITVLTPSERSRVQHKATHENTGQPTPAPASQAESTQEKRLTDEETGKNLELDTGKAKIRGYELYTNWYRTSARHAIRAPRAGLRAEHGFLYLHRHKGGLRVWMWFDDAQCPRGRSSLSPTSSSAVEQREQREQRGARASGRWERIHSGHAHPTLEGYVLHVLEDDRPQWASRGAVRQYQKKMRMKARMKALLP